MSSQIPDIIPLDYKTKLTQIVTTVLIRAGADISLLGSGKMEQWQQSDGYWYYFEAVENPPRYEELASYRFIIASFVTDVVQDKDAKYGFKMSKSSIKYSILGYLAVDVSDFMPDDFTITTGFFEKDTELKNYFQAEIYSPEGAREISLVLELLN